MNLKPFAWKKFEEYFSTERIMYSQGEYEALVINALKSIREPKEKVSLMNLLDLRLITLLELVYISDEYENDSGKYTADTIDARLQINKNICWQQKISATRHEKIVDYFTKK